MIMASRGKSSRLVYDDYDDSDETPDYQTSGFGKSRQSYRSPVRRNHTDEEDEEEPPRSGRGGASRAHGKAPAYDSEGNEGPSRSGRGGPSRSRGGTRADNPEEDEEPHASARGAAKSSRGKGRSYESDREEPTTRGSRAGPSRALVVRDKSNKGKEATDDEDEVVSVLGYEAMGPRRLGRRRRPNPEQLADMMARHVQFLSDKKERRAKHAEYMQWLRERIRKRDWGRADSEPNWWGETEEDWLRDEVREKRRMRAVELLERGRREGRDINVQEEMKREGWFDRGGRRL